MYIATARSKTSKNWRTQEITWEKFLSRLRTPTRTGETASEYAHMSKAERDQAKEIAGGFVGGTLAGGRRKTSTVVDRWLVTLDADAATQGAWESATMLVDNTMACYSTHSHTAAKPRLRWVLPVDRPMTPDEYPAVARKVAEWLDIETMDPTTYEVARLMYWPTCSRDGEYVFHEQGGPILSVDAVLAEYGYGDAWKDVTLWPCAKAEERVRVRAAKAAGDPLEKSGPVGAFCRTYDVEDAIAEFLPDVYAPCDGDDHRYTYTGGSTAGGAIVYNDGRFLYSNHATDPAGGHSQNSFDLVRIHKFGELDDNAREDTTATKLPSYQKMCEWVAQLPEIKKQLIARVEEDFSDLAGTPEPSAAEKSDEGWETGLKLNSKTMECEPLVENATLILFHDPKLKACFGTDSFSGRPRLRRDPPWGRSGRVKDPARGAEWTDTDESGLILYLESNWKFSSRKAVADALRLAMDEFQFNPVRDYLESLKWDGTPRVETVFHRHLGAKDTRFVRAATRKWLAAAVARVMTPGCKFDSCIVLVGPQNLGKSSFADVLSRGWFNDSEVRMSDKEGYQTIHGSWIVELAELASVKRSEVETVKSFLSKREDTFRPSYGKNTVTLPRQCVFFGTTNEAEFLRDRTGNRRFWPIEVRKKMNREKLAAEVDQLWAEAVEIWKSGEKLWLDTEELEADLAETQVQYNLQDELADQLADFLDEPVPDNWESRSREERREYFAASGTRDLETATHQREYISLSEIRVELCDEGLSRGGGNDTLSRRLAGLMNTMPGWKKADGKRRVPGYGVRQVYIRA